MKAFLLAGGLGTRLRPLTDKVPKCLAPVLDKPLLDYWIEQLIEQACCDSILINTHYLNEQVESHVQRSPYRDYITLTHETRLLGTLGSVKANADFFEDDNFILAHADNLCVTDWSEFINYFNNRPSKCDLTMMLFHTNTPESCGMVKIDGDNVLNSYKEKPASGWNGTLANAAVFIMSPEALLSIVQTPEYFVDLCGEFIPQQIRKINTYINRHILIDIGTPEKLALANKVVNRDTVKWRKDK